MLDHADFVRVQAGADISDKLAGQMFYSGASGSATKRLPAGKHHICFEPEADEQTQLQIDVDIVN